MVHKLRVLMTDLLGNIVAMSVAVHFCSFQACAICRTVISRFKLVLPLHQLQHQKMDELRMYAAID